MTTTLSTPKSSKEERECWTPASFFETLSFIVKRSIHPFDPIVENDSKTLILGSFPSIKSFDDSFYYAHPRNQFWPILSMLFDMPAGSKEERIELLKRTGIALWDVIAECERSNSSDTNLQACRPNDIPALLKNYPNIESILFTGKKAYTLYNRHYKSVTNLPLFLLPSPSPAYAAMPFEEKRRIWREIFLKLPGFDESQIRSF